MQARTLHQNSVAKRQNKTIMELVGNMAIKKKFGMIFHENKFQHKSNISNLRMFGCLGYIHIPKEQRKKIDNKTRKCLFLGYNIESKAYMMYDTKDKRILISKDVISEK
uniref:Retroviral polymerase SH3-like domain-containing protein n=1 Tax=Physcomitrium patens TaxID=3218 RepID=A0A2K1IFL1_PHYPA|nr:hypothetical protein PHYPA_028650 [Physcomitrium patens]